jgi:hypothetical protein
MKPILITADPIRFNKEQKKILKEFAGTLMDGEIDSGNRVDLPGYQKVREHMLSLLEKEGWSYSDRRVMYANEDLTVVGGSVVPHIDSSLGMFAVMPLLFNGGSGSRHWDRRDALIGEFSLATAHGHVIGTLGDIMVFNADVWHAWICNQCCVMYSMTVKKKRGFRPAVLD